MDNSKEPAPAPGASSVTTLPPTTTTMVPSEKPADYMHEERVVKKGPPVALGSQEMTFVRHDADPKAATNHVAQRVGQELSPVKGNRLAQAQQEIKAKRAAMTLQQRVEHSQRLADWDAQHQRYRQGDASMPEAALSTWRQKLKSLVDSIKRLF